MWFWIIIIAVIIGAAIGFLGSNGDSEEAVQGGLAGGCMAANCLFRIFIAGLCLFIIISLFSWLFG